MGDNKTRIYPLRGHMGFHNTVHMEATPAHSLLKQLNRKSKTTLLEYPGIVFFFNICSYP